MTARTSETRNAMDSIIAPSRDHEIEVDESRNPLDDCFLLSGYPSSFSRGMTSAENSLIPFSASACVRNPERPIITR